MNLPSRCRDLGARLTFDHHSQAVIPIILVLACTSTRSLIPLLLSLPYLGMQLRHGGRGTFQRPLADDSSPGILDVITVVTGVVSAAAFLGFVLWRWVSGILAFLE